MIKLSQRDIPTLTFMIGIPGAGKSQWIKNNTGENTVIVSPDALRKELLGNINDQTKNGQIWAVAKERVISALNDGRDVILDATNVASKNRRNFLTGLPAHKLLAKVFEGDPDVSYERIQKQIQRGEERANVPHGAIVNMHNQFKQQSNPEQLNQEGFEII